MHLHNLKCILYNHSDYRADFRLCKELEVSVWAEHQCVVYRNKHVPPLNQYNPDAVCILNRESCCRWHLFLKCVFVLQKNMRTTGPLCFGVWREVWSGDHFISDSPQVDLWTKQTKARCSIHCLQTVRIMSHRSRKLTCLQSQFNRCLELLRSLINWALYFNSSIFS